MVKSLKCIINNSSIEMIKHFFKELMPKSFTKVIYCRTQKCIRNEYL